jgi:membrane protease YdiL (CAAX protease family)
MNALARHLKGHVLFFDAPETPGYGPATGLRMLLIFLLMEIVIGPRWGVFGLHPIPRLAGWIRILLTIVLTLALVTRFARLSPRQIGLRPWREWSVTERSYFVQVLVIANVVFGLIYAARLRAMFAGSWALGAILLVTGLLWGLQQELTYRGILQTELVRRWGAVPGILISNLIFTFGPLHFYHFQGPAPLPMFAAIFAIGLLFAMIFRRSGNLVIVGVLHGLGNFYIGG